MKTLLKLNILTAFLISSFCYSYTDVTPEDVHNRLAEGDTLILLDVREITEFMNGHIAEPVGQLPVTPVFMSWNSNVLASDFSLLPTDMDIIVYCQSGGRSALASAFLETNGFTRIFNMLGGFSSWIYESRQGGFGDHTGKWINPLNPDPVEIVCTETGDTSRIIFPPDAYPATDSIYIEMHFASPHPFIPPDVPQSDIEGLFRITVLNHRGLSLFEGDSITLSNSADLSFRPYIQGNIVFDPDLAIFIPGDGWQSVQFNFNIPEFEREEAVLRKWYNASAFLSTSLEEKNAEPGKIQFDVFPNPFNGSINIFAPKDAVIRIFDITGRLIKILDSDKWTPEVSIGSGFYIVQVSAEKLTAFKKVVYLK